MARPAQRASLAGRISGRLRASAAEPPVPDPVGGVRTPPGTGMIGSREAAVRCVCRCRPARTRDGNRIPWTLIRWRPAGSRPRGSVPGNRVFCTRTENPLDDRTHDEP